ncbi:MAG: anti-sigma factor family protein [Blastocatellia bacterium]
MSCENWLPLIEEYLDGELNRKQSVAVQTHIASCKTCAAEYELLKREQEVYSGYDQGLDLSPDMWLAVRARIRQEAGSTRGSFLSRLREIVFGASAGWKFSPALVALLVIAAIALTIVIMRSVDKRPEPQIASTNIGQPAPSSPGNTQPKNVVPPVAQPSPGESTPAVKVDRVAGVAPRTDVRYVRRDEVTPQQLTPQQVVNRAVEQNLAAIKLLNREITKRRSDLDPMEIARFETALKSVDQTIAETRQAALKHPNDPVAARYMLDAYAQKVEIMKDMAGAQPMSTDEVAHPNR